MSPVRETIPVRAGRLTLLYPKWIPGNHSQTGPISKVAGLAVTANRKEFDWVRDPIDVYAFHIEIPQGVSSIEVAFQYLAPMRSKEGRISISSEIADLAWNTVALYPAGYFSRPILRRQRETAAGLEVCHRPRNRLTRSQRGSFQRDHFQYSGRFAALCRYQFQAGGSLDRCRQSCFSELCAVRRRILRLRRKSWSLIARWCSKRRSCLHRGTTSSTISFSC